MLVLLDLTLMLLIAIIQSYCRLAITVYDYFSSFGLIFPYYFAAVPTAKVSARRTVK